MAMIVRTHVRVQLQEIETEFAPVRRVTCAQSGEIGVEPIPRRSRRQRREGAAWSSHETRGRPRTGTPAAAL
jgi:hypothetical protein